MTHKNPHSDTGKQGVRRRCKFQAGGFYGSEPAIGDMILNPSTQFGKKRDDFAKPGNLGSSRTYIVFAR